MVKIVGSALEFQKAFHIGQVLVKMYGLKTVTAIQYIGNRKSPHLIDKTNPLITVEV